MVKGTRLGASSGIDGEYSILNIPPGSYRILAIMMGYRTEYKHIEISGGETHQLDFNLQETVIEMTGMVVTGTRTHRYIRDVPVRTEVITADDIRARGAINLYQALEGFPGIRVEPQCSACEFTMVRMQGLSGDHVQILIDGQPIYSGLAAVFGLQQIPVENIERIEVIKGASSVLHGSGAIAGVINVITRKPVGKPMLSLTTQFGSYGTNLYSFSASYAREDMDMILTAQQHTRDAIFWDDDELHGYDEYISDRVRSENRALGFRVNLHDLVGDDILSWTGRTLHEHRRGGDRRTFANPFAEGAEHIDTERYETSIGYQKGWGLGRRLSINLGYVSHRREATNDAFIGDCLSLDWNEDGECDDTFPGSDFLRPYIAKENTYMLDVNNSFSIFDRHTLLAGIQYRHSELEEKGMFVDSEAQCAIEADINDTLTLNHVVFEATSEKSADDLGIFLQNEFRITEDLELVAGVRYDWHRSESNFAGSGDITRRVPVMETLEAESFNPRVAIAFRATEALTLRTSVGTGFRVPFAFAEDAHLCSASPRIYKPAGLKPERSISYNLSADYDHKRYTISASIFRTNLKDKIALASACCEAEKLGYGHEWENIDDAYTQGVELGSRIALTPDLILGLNLTYTDAQYGKNRCDFCDTPYYDKSKYIPRVPSPTANIGVEWRPGNWSM
ncbi:TonB-dependent receptor, partial [candidate division WOR-3 bacterium]|nr:TonB-dependent receptor [candidate division WOR-3 bacterium]